MNNISKENKTNQLLKDEKEKDQSCIEKNTQESIDEKKALDSTEPLAKFDKEEYVYQKLIKKKNHVYSCIANVLRNYNIKQVLDEFIPEREKGALRLANLLMTKDSSIQNDIMNLSTDQYSLSTKEIISLSAINFLINQICILSTEKEGEMEFSKDAKDHLIELALQWAKLRDQAFMFSNGMISLEYELHDEFTFKETELYHETEKKLLSIGVSQQSNRSTKLKEARDQRRKMSDRTITELVDLVKAWHSEIAYLRRITEFYASMRQLTEEEIEALSILFENFGSLMELKDLHNLFKEIKMSKINELRSKKGHLESTENMRLLLYDTILKFNIGNENVPYFLCRKITKNNEEIVQISLISLLLFSRFCNSYSETTRSKKAHDLELITSEIASLSGWEVVDQNVEILSEGDTVTEIDIIIHRNKVNVIIEVKDLALWRGWYFDRESLTKRYEIFITAVKKLKERKLLLKNTDAKLLIVTALAERWKTVEDIPIVPLKSLHKYLKKLKRVETKRTKSSRR